MQQIAIYSVFKASDLAEVQNYTKMAARWADISHKNCFNKKMESASGQIEAQKMYLDAFCPHINGYCVGLDERGELLDSIQFAQMIKDRAKISFFIGGAWGLGDELRGRMSKIISLGRLTMAHKIAKLVLSEQIYRALSINANHPYHK